MLVSAVCLEAFFLVGVNEVRRWMKPLGEVPRPGPAWPFGDRAWYLGMRGFPTGFGALTTLVLPTMMLAGLGFANEDPWSAVLGATAIGGTTFLLLGLFTSATGHPRCMVPPALRPGGSQEHLLRSSAGSALPLESVELPSEVKRKMQEEFPPWHWSQVASVLGYVDGGADTQIAVLILADGELPTLYHFVEVAQSDPRRVSSLTEDSGAEP